MSRFDPTQTRKPGEPLRASDLDAVQDLLAEGRATHGHGGAPLSWDRLAASARVQAQSLDAGRIWVEGVELGPELLAEGAREGLNAALGASFNGAGGRVDGALGVQGDLNVSGGLSVGGKLLMGASPVASKADPWGSGLSRIDQAKAITPPESSTTGAYLTGERLRVAYEAAVVSLTLEIKHASVIWLRAAANLSQYDNNDYSHLGESPPRFPAYGMLGLFVVYGGLSLPLNLLPSQRPNQSRLLSKYLPAVKARPEYKGISSQWRDALGWPFHFPAKGMERASGQASLTELFWSEVGSVTVELRSYTTNTLITDGYLEALTMPLQESP